MCAARTTFCGVDVAPALLAALFENNPRRVMFRTEQQINEVDVMFQLIRPIKPEYQAFLPPTLRWASMDTFVGD